MTNAEWAAVRGEGFTPARAVETEREHEYFQVEVIDRAAEFAALRPEWSELLESSRSSSIFLTWEWLFTWWRHLSADRTLSILLVRSAPGRELVAIAPFCVNNRRLAGTVPFRTIEFLGTGTVCSDHLDVIVRTGAEQTAIRVLAEHLAQRKSVLKLVHFDRHSSLVSQLAAELQRRGWTASEVTLTTSPFIKFTGSDWDSYLGILEHDFRREVQRRLRKLHNEFEVQIEQAQTEQDRSAALSLLFELHRRRWEDRGGSKALYSRELRAFHEEVTRLALANGWLRLIVLRLDGKPAAARYGFRYGPTYYSYQSGFDPAFARQWIGNLSFAITIRKSMEEGAEEHDLLAGNEKYKSRLAPDARELGRLELYPPGRRRLFWRRALKLYRFLRTSDSDT